MAQDGEILYDIFEKLIEFQIQNGTCALIVCATTGESSTLTDVEYASLIRIAKDTAKGRVPVIAGSGSNSTAKTVEKSKTAEKMGADALLVVTPYYNRPNQEGLIEHFRAVSNASTLPIILYDVPIRTGICLEAGSYEGEHGLTVSRSFRGLPKCMHEGCPRQAVAVCFQGKVMESSSAALHQPIEKGRVSEQGSMAFTVM